MTPLPFTPLTADELRNEIHAAIARQIDLLPQLKGKGAPTRIDKAAAVRTFANAVAEQFRLQNNIVVKGAPSVCPSTPPPPAKP